MVMINTIGDLLRLLDENEEFLNAAQQETVIEEMVKLPTSSTRSRAR